jgi:phosphoglycolate phosphatase
MTTTRGRFDVVCWDWNGTLLNDVEIARAAMNRVLRNRRLPVIADEDAYRRVFGFPIVEFYSRLGLDEGSFVQAADQYLALFAQTVGQASLHREAAATLAAIDALGVEQVLISATPDVVLAEQLAPHAVGTHFSRILGITDVYAASKAHVVESWLRGSGHDPRRVLMVGDTNHDEEIAELLHLEFLRFARGHQHPPGHRRHPVADDLREVVAYVSSLSGRRRGPAGDRAGCGSAGE